MEFPDLFKQLLSIFYRSNEKILYKGRSDYRLLTVIENFQRQERIMYAGNRRFVAGIKTDSGFPLHSPYFIADIFIPLPKSILFLGGGPQAVPSYIWRVYCPQTITIIERDQLNTCLARKYFNMPTARDYRVLHEEAYEFLTLDKIKYDIIFSNLGTTRRRTENPKDLKPLYNTHGIMLQKHHLKPRGVLITTFIARLTGDDKKFVLKIYQKYKSIFPSVYLFSDFQDLPQKIQLHFILATASTSNLFAAYKKFINSPIRKQSKDIYEGLIYKINIH